MAETTGDIRQSIQKAIEYQQKHLKDFSNYAPVYNSLTMLNQINENIKSNSYLLINLNKLNVGLLAARSLDVEKKESHLYSYASLLHNIWFSVLNFLRITTSAPTKGNKLIAYKFYQKHHYDHSRIINHMSCIDFTYPVQTGLLTKSFNVGQWKISSIPQGDYYAEMNKCITPSCLGIYDYQEDNNGNIFRRRKHTYGLQNDVHVLQSVALGVLDTWSVKSTPIQTRGGCTQYFNSIDKIEFQKIWP